MSTGIFSIGVSGLAAAQLGLLTTEHNVVNANTPGYTRQRTVQASNIAVNTGSGAIGQGVHVQTIERMYDRFLTGQVNTAQTQVSELETYYSQIQQIDSMLADPDAGLSPALQNFFSGVQQVASNPSSLPSRQSMVSSAQTLAARFQNLDNRLVELADQVNGRISGAVTEINTYASQLADINQRIVIAEAGYGQPVNDLLDQRDQLVSELNKLIKVSTSTNADGTYNVYIGSGQQLVVGAKSMEMTATQSTADPSKIVVGLKTAGGTMELPESLIVGGELAGLIDFRNQSLGATANELGRVAASLALTFNAQNSLGQDLIGKISSDTGFVGDIFLVPDPKVVANNLNTGSGNIDAAFSAPTPPSAPDYEGNFYTDLTTSDYQVQFGAAGAYTVTRLSDNQTVQSGTGVGSVSFDGVTLNISAVGNNGDRFVIKPFSEVARNIEVDSRVIADPRLIAAAAPVRVTQDIGNTGSMKISQGVVGTAYDVSALPATITATATQLTGVPNGWRAIYSDGTVVPPMASPAGTGAVDLVNGGNTLSKLVFSGMSFEVTGTSAAGDEFVVQRNTAGVQDGRNALLFGALQTQNTVAGGTATFQSAYARLVSDNGIRTREAKVRLEAQTAVLEQSQATRDSLSAVNLDEEAANLLKFQQAYMASSKILEIGSKLFETILSIG